MNIKYCDCYDKLPYEIRKALNDANIIYSKEYYNYVKSEGKYIIYIYSNLFIMPVIILKRYFFKYAELPTEYFPWGTGESICPDEKSFLDECMKLIKGLKVMWVNHPYTLALFRTFPSKSVRIPFGSYVINLMQTEEEIWANFHTKHRNSVRRAEKSGVIIKSGHKELINDFYKLDIETRKRSKMSVIDINYYITILKCFQDNFIIFVAYKEDIPQGAAGFLFNKSMCYYMYGASCDGPDTGSMNLLHWEAIKYMKARGIKSYNFVGCRIDEDLDSKYHGIQRFKARFGGELKECYLFKLIFKKHMYLLFTVLCNIKSRLAGEYFKGDIIDQEIQKWKELNNREMENA